MIFIDNCQDLLIDIEEYKKKFPETHMSYYDIKKNLEERFNDPVGSVFGIEVAKDWLDKCYGFEVDRVTPENTIFRYVGIWKT